MPRVRFLTTVLGIPDGRGRPTVSFEKGTVAQLTDEQWNRVAGRRDLNGRLWCVVEEVARPTRSDLATFQRGRKPAEPEGYVCSVCGARFSSGNALGGHMKSHRNGHGHQVGGVDSRVRLDRTPPGEIECPVEDCPRSFTSEFGLKVHMGRQHGDRASPPP